MQEYYDDPLTFNPDRFKMQKVWYLRVYAIITIQHHRWSSENIHRIDMNTFLPFGLGPRGCLGVRFAMEQMKMALSILVEQFEFFPVKKTLVSKWSQRLLEAGENSI